MVFVKGQPEPPKLNLPDVGDRVRLHKDFLPQSVEWSPGSARLVEGEHIVFTSPTADGVYQGKVGIISNADPVHLEGTFHGRIPGYGDEDIFTIPITQGWVARRHKPREINEETLFDVYHISPLGIELSYEGSNEFRVAAMAIAEIIKPAPTEIDPTDHTTTDADQSIFSEVPEPEIAPELSPETPPLGCVVHVRHQPYDVYIGRANATHGLEGSKWHNPYRIGRDGDRSTVLQKFERHLLGSADLMAALEELRDKRIACWCCEPDEVLTADDPPKCHGQILLKALRGDYRDESGSVLEHCEKPHDFRFERNSPHSPTSR